MDGCLKAAEIEAFVAGELSAKEKVRCEAHLASCADCRKAVEARQADAHLAGDIQGAYQSGTVTKRHEEAAAPAMNGVGSGTRIGPYKLLEILGEGGFGTVYLAEQNEPVRRRVALKLIKLGMDTREVIARFDSERQALALMNHAHVAAVYDAGATEQGRPYFVMEHVPGEPITAYCDKHQLSLPERLNLFMQVCHAIQHAHQKGIIHRDIKPTNVLVMYQDGKPVPKVIDFGVAKATDQRLAEKTVFTEQGVLLGTPAYMSPEQAEMTTLDIDTRTDVYSLGVLLYELLTGMLPFDPKVLRSAGFAAIQRIIREVEPSKPSTKLGNLLAGDDESASDAAEKRRLDPRTLMRRLRGDLDWITMKALEKDRTRRYDSASDLAADIERYLRNEPVDAGPPGVGYRVSKFVRRNRVGVIAASAVLVVLLAGITVTTWGLLAAMDARDAESEAKEQTRTALMLAEQREREAEDARTRAEAEADNARAINNFLTDDLLAAVAPSAKSGKGKDVLMRDVLDAASQKIEEASQSGGRFANKPLIEASIRYTLGWTYRLLGEYSNAEPHLERARVLRDRELGKEHTSRLSSMSGLAILYDDQGRYDEAEPLYVKTLEISKRVLGEEHRDTLAIMNNLAVLHECRGRYHEAEPIYLETLEIRKRVLGDEHPETLSSMCNLAGLYVNQGRYDEAEPLHVKTLEIKKRTLGEEHPSTLYSMNSLAALYWYQGRYDKAEPLYVKTLETRRRILGEEHPSTLSTTDNLALLYKSQGQYDEAEPLHVRTLKIKKRTLGEEHPNTLFSMANLASLYVKQERLEEAEALQAQAVDASRRVWTEGTWFIGAFRGDHGRTLLKLHRYRDAQAALVEAHEVLKDSLGSDHARTIDGIKSLSDLYDAWHVAEPGAGHDAEAAAWRAKLEAWRATTQPATPRPSPQTTSQPLPAPTTRPTTAPTAAQKSPSP